MWHLAAAVLGALACLNEATSLKGHRRGRSLTNSESGIVLGLDIGQGVQVQSHAEVMSTMTMEKAYKLFLNVSLNRSHSEASLVKFIQDKLHKREEPKGYAAVDKARDLLNEMMNSAQENREEEYRTCSAYQQSTTVTLISMAQQITYVNSEASAAEAEKSRCEEIIYIVQIKIQSAYKDLEEHNERCKITIATLVHQISIVRQDIVVMEKIVKMVCQDTSSFSSLQLNEGDLRLSEGSTVAEDGAIVRCNTCKVRQHTAWIQGGIGSLLTGLKSDASKSYLQSHLLDEFESGSLSAPSKVGTLVLSQEGSRYMQSQAGRIPKPDPMDVKTIVLDAGSMFPKHQQGHCNEQMIGENASTYRGCQSETISGRTCQNWVLTTPQHHGNLMAEYPDAGLGAHNFCRNPDGQATIWCYTTDPAVRAELCQPKLELEAASGLVAHDCVPSSNCKFIPKPNCRRLRDRFSAILVGLRDRRDDMITLLSKTRIDCESKRQWYRQMITTLEVQLKEEQTNLGVALKHLVVNTQFSITYNMNYKSLTMEYHKELSECCFNKNALTSEICALTKIRGELYKLEGLKIILTDCEVSEWVEEECSVSCGGGVQNLFRTVIIHSTNGTECPPMRLEQSCNTQGCPTDCDLTEWENWGTCSAECGGGVHSKSRKKVTDQLNGGSPCSALSETETCHCEACDQPCVLKPWSDWSLCSMLCGGGHEGRQRDIEIEATGTGECDGAMSDHRRAWRDCNTQKCPPHFICTSMVDVIILLDGSSSLEESGWEKSKSFVKKFASLMIGNDTGVNLGVMIFSGPETVELLDNCTGENSEANPTPAECGMTWVSRFEDTMSEIGPAIDKEKWPAGGTYTSMALAEATSQLVDGRPNAETVVIVVTDGAPASPVRTTRAANALKEKARLMWVSVANSKAADMDNMRSWASVPWQDNVMEIDTMAVMDTTGKVNRLVSMFCNGLEAVAEELQGGKGTYPE